MRFHPVLAETQWVASLLPAATGTVPYCGCAFSGEPSQTSAEMQADAIPKGSHGQRILVSLEKCTFDRVEEPGKLRE